MAGISKLMNMGLMSIVGGGGGDNAAGPGGVLDAMKNPGGMSSMSLLDGDGNSTSIRAQPPPIPRGFLSDWIPPAPRQLADEKKLDSAGNSALNWVFPSRRK